jgi:hypothetical protein
MFGIRASSLSISLASTLAPIRGRYEMEKPSQAMSWAISLPGWGHGVPARQRGLSGSGRARTRLCARSSASNCLLRMHLLPTWSGRLEASNGGFWFLFYYFFFSKLFQPQASNFHEVIEAGSPA